MLHGTAIPLSPTGEADSGRQFTPKALKEHSCTYAMTQGGIAARETLYLLQVLPEALVRSLIKHASMVECLGVSCR